MKPKKNADSLKALLALYGLKHSDVAEALGVSTSCISLWVRNGIPTSRVAELALATGIPARELRPDMALLFGPSGQ